MLLLATLVLALACLTGVAIHLRPRWGAAAWLLTIAFVPIWLGVNLPFYFYPASLLAILILVAVFPISVGVLGLTDLLTMMFFIACLAPMISGGATITTVFVALTQWLLAFLVGRLLPSKVGLTWIYSCVAVVFSIVAIMAFVEFFSGWNPFVGLGPMTQLHQNWSALQGRGGQVRAEGAFGHSIALGSCLALAIPLTMASTFRPTIRILMSALLLGAVIMTLSRVSMLGAGIATVLAVVFLRHEIPRAVRVGGSLLMLVIGTAIAPFITAVLSSAGDEVTLSAAYRSSLTDLIPFISPLGFSSVARRSATGELFFGRFRSIDSQLIFTGLSYGWVALGTALILLIAAVLAVLRRVASPGTLAVVAQIPALATVALITQYSMFFWFVAGLAAAGQVRSRAGRDTDDGAANRTSSDAATGERSVDALSTPVGIDARSFHRARTAGSVS